MTASKVCLIGEALIRRSDKMEFPETQIYSSPWFHWAVFANDTVYEVTGDYRMTVVDYDFTEEQFRNGRKIFFKINLNDTSISNPEEVRSFITSWVYRHPVYSLIGSNCQDFAKDFAQHFFGVVLETQVNQYQALGLFFFQSFTYVVYVVYVGVSLAMIFFFLYYVLTWYGDRLAKQLAGHID